MREWREQRTRREVARFVPAFQTACDDRHRNVRVQWVFEPRRPADVVGATARIVPDAQGLLERAGCFPEPRLKVMGRLELGPPWRQRFVRYREDLALDGLADLVAQ